MTLCFWKDRWNVECFDGADGPRWRIRAGNGEIIATSEAYSSKEARDKTAERITRVRLVPTPEPKK